MAASLSERPYSKVNRVPSDGTVLYLAYGSNMCAQTFQDRRNILPLAAVNVVVPELELTFDLPGVPYLEPCFANCKWRDVDQDEFVDAAADAEEKQDSKALIGVVYEIRPEGYQHVIATEGPTYTDVVVNCNILLPPGSASTSADNFPKQLKAHTLLAPASVTRKHPPGKPAQPTARYLRLLRNGATEHNLPGEWQQYLQSLQPYQVTTRRQLLGRILLVGLLAPAVFSIFGLRRLTRYIFGETPPLVLSISTKIFRGIWIMYDSVFKKLFGDGERTRDQSSDGMKAKII
jgi:hypothetical protein